MYVCSLDPKQLTTRQWLGLVRRHWAVESAPQAHRKEGVDELTDCAQAA